MIYFTHLNILVMDYFEILSALSLPVGVLILLLLVFRSLVLWYFRIPDMIEKQEKLIQTIQKQNALLAKRLGANGQQAEEEEKKERALSFTELRYGKS